MTETVETASGSLAERIWAAVGSEEVQLPPLPELTLRLRELLADEDKADARKVADLVRNEPAISAALLRCANSAAFGGLRPISDLGQAIARLGLSRVGSLVTGIQIKGQFPRDTAEKRKRVEVMWDHSVATAVAAKRLVERGGGSSDEGFLAGLLHDSGRLLIDIALEQVAKQDASIDITPAVLNDVMLALHAKLGHHTLKSWALPEEICEVVLRHEDEPAAGDPLLLTAVQAADLVAKKMGCHENPQPDLDLLGEPSIEALGLKDIELAMLLVDLEEELEQVRKLF